MLEFITDSKQKYQIYLLINITILSSVIFILCKIYLVNRFKCLHL